MDFEIAIRLTEILLGFAFLQQCIEHLCGAQLTNRILFGTRAIFCLLLICGMDTPLVLIGLCLIAIYILNQFNGPYNGGSDRMGLLVLFCLTAVHWVPTSTWQEYIFGYIAIQLVLSYFIAGWVKIKNPEWRRGRALQDVFLFSAYPTSQSLRSLANYPRLLFLASWGVMAFEVLFPLAFLNQTALAIAMCMATIFHLANAYLFGFNRFFWIWISAYPSLLWLQDRLLF